MQDLRMQMGDILEGRGLFPRRFIVEQITDASVFITELQWMDEKHPGCMKRTGDQIRCKKRPWKNEGQFYLMLPSSTVNLHKNPNAEITIL